MTYRVVGASPQAACCLVLVAAVLGVGSTASAAQPTLQNDVFYECGGERFLVSHCRSDGDRPGMPATQPAGDYCDVWYPDRPKRNGFSIHLAELRGDILAKLQACQTGQAAVPSSAPSPPTAPSAPTAASTPSAPSGLDAEFQLGRQFLDKGQYEDALRQFELVRKSRPNDPDTVWHVGLAQHKLGRNGDALATFQHLTRLNVDRAGLAAAHWFIGAIQLDDWRYPESIAAFKEAARLMPDNPTYCCLDLADTVIGSAELEVLGGKEPNPALYVEAVQAYERTLALVKSPGDDLYSTLLGLGWAKYRLAKCDEAIPTYGRLIAMKPPGIYLAPALIGTGMCHNTRQRYDQALDALAKGLTAWPRGEQVSGYVSEDDAVGEMGFALYMVGRYPDAAEAYEAAVKLAPGLPEYQAMLGTTYLRMGRKDDALRIYETLNASKDPAFLDSARMLLGQINQAK